MSLTKDVVRLLFRRGTAAQIKAESISTAITHYAGEPYYATDTKKSYAHDGTFPRRIHGLDMVVTYQGEIVVSSGEIVWSGEY